MTAPTIDYYLTVNSPWTYLGHERFVAIARAAGASVRVLPVDYGKIFPVSGGLPLAKRAPQRQAYRLVELKRFSEHLGVPMNLQPKFFPVDATLANRVVTAAREAQGAETALTLAGAFMRAVWAEERDLADRATLAAVLAECGLPSGWLEAGGSDAIGAVYDADTQRAIEGGVFGAPTYVVGGELFWGQDRLEFLERRLSRG